MADPETLLEPGRILASKGASYRVLRHLGSGSFGTVVKCSIVDCSSALPRFRGADPLTVGDFVAVKVAKDTPVLQAQAELEVRVLGLLHERAAVEAREAGSAPLGSDNVVRVIDHFRLPGIVCVVTEFLPMTLLDVLERGGYRGLPLSAVRAVTRQVCAALHFVHAQGLCHGDIKPENVMVAPRATPAAVSATEGSSAFDRVQAAAALTPTGGVAATCTVPLQLLRNGAEAGVHGAGSQALAGDSVLVKLIDFGSCAPESRMTSGYIQSRYYRAPEAMLGLGVDGSVDLWSLGCVAAELALGIPLFPGADDADMLWRVTQTLGLPPSWMVKAGAQGEAFFRALSADDEGRLAPPQPPRPLFPAPALQLLRGVWKARKALKKKALAALRATTGAHDAAPSTTCSGGGDISAHCSANTLSDDVAHCSANTFSAPGVPSRLRKLMTLELGQVNSSDDAARALALPPADRDRVATQALPSVAATDLMPNPPGLLMPDAPALTAQVPAERQTDIVIAVARDISAADLLASHGHGASRLRTFVTGNNGHVRTASQEIEPLSPQHRAVRLRLGVTREGGEGSASSTEHAGGVSRRREPARTQSSGRLAQPRSGSVFSSHDAAPDHQPSGAASGSARSVGQHRDAVEAAATPVSASLDALLLGIVSGDAYYHLTLGDVPAGTTRPAPHALRRLQQQSGQQHTFGQITPHVLVLPFGRPGRRLVAPAGAGSLPAVAVLPLPSSEYQDNAVALDPGSSDPTAPPAVAPSLVARDGQPTPPRPPPAALLRRAATSSECGGEPRITGAVVLSQVALKTDGESAVLSSASATAVDASSAAAHTNSGNHNPSAPQHDEPAAALSSAVSGASENHQTLAVASEAQETPTAAAPPSTAAGVSGRRAEGVVSPAACSSALAELQWRGTFGGTLPVRLTSAHTGFVCLRKAAVVAAAAVESRDTAEALSGSSPRVRAPGISGVRLASKDESLRRPPPQDPVYHPFASLTALVLAAAVASSERARAAASTESVSASSAAESRVAAGAVTTAAAGSATPALGIFTAAKHAAPAPLIQQLSKQRPDSVPVVGPASATATSTASDLSLCPDATAACEWVQERLLASGAVSTAADARVSAAAFWVLPRAEAVQWLEFLDFLLRCLSLEPHKRLTAAQALAHPFLLGAGRSSTTKTTEASGGDVFQAALPDIARRDRRLWASRRATSRVNLRRIMSDREAERLIALEPLPPVAALAAAPAHRQVGRNPSSPGPSPVLSASMQQQRQAGGAPLTGAQKLSAVRHRRQHHARQWLGSGGGAAEESSVGRPASALSGAGYSVGGYPPRPDSVFSGGGVSAAAPSSATAAAAAAWRHWLLPTGYPPLPPPWHAYYYPPAPPPSSAGTWPTPMGAPGLPPGWQAAWAQAATTAAASAATGAIPPNAYIQNGPSRALPPQLPPHLFRPPWLQQQRAVPQAASVASASVTGGDLQVDAGSLSAMGRSAPPRITQAGSTTGSHRV